MTRFEVPEAGRGTGLQGFTTPVELSQYRPVDATKPQAVNADYLLGSKSKFELVQNAEKQPSPEEIQRGLRALLGDAMSGNSWSKDSIDTWQKVFDSEKGVKGATPESIARGLNMIGAAINGRVKPELEKIPGRRSEPVGMAVMQNADGSYSFYMMLSKDDAALQKNRADIIAGKASPTVIKVGTFKPSEGQPI